MNDKDILDKIKENPYYYFSVNNPTDEMKFVAIMGNSKLSNYIGEIPNVALEYLNDNFPNLLVSLDIKDDKQIDSILEKNERYILTLDPSLITLDRVNKIKETHYTVPALLLKDGVSKEIKQYLIRKYPYTLQKYLSKVDDIIDDDLRGYLLDGDMGFISHIHHMKNITHEEFLRLYIIGDGIIETPYKNPCYTTLKTKEFIVCLKEPNYSLKKNIIESSKDLRHLRLTAARKGNPREIFNILKDLNLLDMEIESILLKRDISLLDQLSCLTYECVEYIIEVSPNSLMRRDRPKFIDHITAMLAFSSLPESIEYFKEGEFSILLCKFILEDHIEYSKYIPLNDNTYKLISDKFSSLKVQTKDI